MSLVAVDYIAQSTEGDALNGASVSIREGHTAGAGDLADIFSDASGTVAANPLTTTPQGTARFWIQPGKYNLTASGAADSTLITVDDPKTYATVAAFAADVTAGYTAPDGATVWIGLLAVAAPIGFASDSSASVTGLPVGWVPFGEITDVHFGAVPDYNDTSDTGTDNLTAITNAMAYAATLGAYVWITGPCLVSDTVSPPDGCRGLKATRPVGSSLDQVGGPAYPSGFQIGSALIGSHTTGPVVHLQYSDQYVHDVELGATSTRQAAAIASTGGTVNCGLLIAPPDTGSPNMTRSGYDNVMARNQPADGFVTCGEMAVIELARGSAINCGRHGHVIDNGEMIGRTLKARPGIIDLKHARGINLGGHELVIGHPDALADQPYRVIVDMYEGFRCGNTPATLYESSASFILGEQITIINTAFSATSGTSGTTPTLSHAYAIGGKGNTILGCRAIAYTAEPVLILESPWVADEDGSTLVISGLHSANGAAADPVNLIEHGGNVVDLRVDNISGSFSGYPIDVATFVGTATIEYNGVRTNYGTIVNNSFTSESVPDDSVLKIQFDGTRASGILIVAGGASSRRAAIVFFRCGSAPHCILMAESDAQVAVTTGALAGTTGVDGNLTISTHTDNAIYIENRTGASSFYTLDFAGLDNLQGKPTGVAYLP